MPSELDVHPLTTDEQILAAYDLMAVLRPRLKRETFLETVRAQMTDGYELAGGFVAGRLVVLAGFRRSRTLSRGPHLFVDDLVTAPDEQGKGYGTAMLRHLAHVAIDSGLTHVWLDSRDT